MGGANGFWVLTCVYDVVVLVWLRLMLVSFYCFLTTDKYTHGRMKRHHILYRRLREKGVGGGQARFMEHG